MGALIWMCLAVLKAEPTAPAVSAGSNEPAAPLEPPAHAVLAEPAADGARASLRPLVVDAEIGPAYVVQNDNRYGPSGTSYTAETVGQQRNLFIGARVSAEARLGERSTVIFLYAPLDLTTRVTLREPLDFRGTTFAAGEVVDHRYLFDGYRGSYLFRALQVGRLRWDVGASLQIRNASVELRSVDAADPRFAVEHDIGVVFALKSRLTLRVTPGFWTSLEVDGFSSFGAFRTFSGGIYDVAFSAGAPVGRGLDAFLRLRLLGGGATVEKRSLENWANLFFVTAGLRADVGALLP